MSDRKKGAPAVFTAPRHRPQPASNPQAPITTERVERALALCAYIMGRDGPVIAPIFERLERELAAMRRQDDTVARAKHLLETYSAWHSRLSLPPPIE